jgi:hypothetical protein
MLNQLRLAGKNNPKIKNYKFWKDGTHAIEGCAEKVLWQKIHYIHQNPVKAKFVHREEDYLFSSARNYHGLPSVIDVECITPPVITVGSPGFYKG